jgi:hypothetical protein
MTDHLCPICYESHNGPINGVWPFASSEPCWPVDQIWRWPCGHGVHAKCIAQTRMSLLTLDGPCYVCRHPCHGGALSNFMRAFPFKGLRETLNRVPDDVASPQQVLAEPIPFVAALCCPRIVGPIDGRFETLTGDRRMSYMGKNHSGSLHWACMTCQREVRFAGLSTVVPPRHACLQHGPMCYVLDAFKTNMGVEHVGRYWSCCDATQQDDVPLPIHHMYPSQGTDELIVLEALVPNIVETIADSQSEDDLGLEPHERGDRGAPVIPANMEIDGTLDELTSADGSSDDSGETYPSDADIELDMDMDRAFRSAAAAENQTDAENVMDDADAPRLLEDDLLAELIPPAGYRYPAVIAVPAVITPRDIDEVAQMERILQSYDTAEEEIALEAMLSQYE